MKKLSAKFVYGFNAFCDLMKTRHFGHKTQLHSSRRPKLGYRGDILLFLRIMSFYSSFLTTQKLSVFPGHYRQFMLCRHRKGPFGPVLLLLGI